jgi:putative hydrolase of the HAD superfamily
MIKVVFFDFGGVLAEEGWVNGLTDIAHHHGFNPVEFFDDACDVLWNTGYMYGRATEDEFWEKFSARYNFTMEIGQMRQIIFDRFVIRTEMFDLVKEISENGFRVAILSDQVNWLDIFNEKYDFFKLFEKVYNSYHLGKGKKDISIFSDVCKDMGVAPAEALFVDDSEGHIGRAEETGLKTVYFTDVKKNIEEIKEILSI